MVNFSKAKIMVIGDVMVDKYIFTHTTKLSFEAPIPVLEVQSSELKIGGAGIVIENISSLLGKAFPIGIVGQDEVGSWLIHKIKKLGIASDGLLIDKSTKTLVRTRVMANNHQVSRFDEPSINLTNVLVSKIIEKIKILIPKIDCVIICDYGMGTINKKMIETIKDLSTKHKKKIIVSPVENHLNYKDPSFIYRIKIDDAKKLLGLRDDNYSTEQICIQLESLLTSKRIILTRGELGVTAYENGAAEDIPSTHHLARDVTSVGEILISTFANAYASGTSFAQSCTMGNVAAGMIIEKIGAKCIKKKELEKALNEYDEWGNQK